MEKDAKDRRKLENSGIDYEFPEVKVNKWRVRGYLKDEHILLKGKKGKQELVKKYNYNIVYEKIKNSYV